MAQKRLAAVVVAVAFACVFANPCYGKHLYVGGRFERSPGSSGFFRSSVTWEEADQSGWTEIGAASTEGSFVTTSHYDHYSKTLFIGGNFSYIGDRPSIPKPALETANFAFLDVETTTWNGTSGRGTAIAVDMASSGDYVYTVSYGGRYVGKDNAVVLEGLDDVWSNIPTDTISARLNESEVVNAIVFWNNRTIVGGRYSLGTNGNVALHGLAYAQIFPTKSSWTPLGNGICDGVIRALHIVGDILYVGGSFSAVNASDCGSPDAVVVNGLAAFNLVINTWSIAGTAFPAGSDIYDIASHNDFNVTYYGGAPAGGNSTENSTSTDLPRFSDDPNKTNRLPLVVVGQFAGLAGNINRMAKYDGTTWTNLTSVPLNATGSIFAVAEMDGNYFVGGDFVNADVGISAIAKFVTSSSTWDYMLGGLSCDAESTYCNGFAPVVYTLSAFPERSELVPAKSPSIFDFFEWKFWSIILAACVVLAMALSIIVNVCFKCCARCKK